MKPSTTRTVPATQGESFRRAMPTQKQTSPAITQRAATTVKLLPRVHLGMMK